MRDGLAVIGLLLASSAVAQPADVPWRASEKLGLTWLRFGLEHRVRAEHLAHDFRHDGDSSGLSLRSLLSAELRLASLVVGAELQDARGWFPSSTPLNTTHVNPLEPLQAYAGLRLAGVVEAGDTLSLSAGRLTLDVGSRRLVARNEFRNTINAFTGVDAWWASAAGDLVRGFAAIPVQRRPSQRDALATARVEIDRENTNALVWGVFLQSRPLNARVQLDAAVFGLHERDGEVASSNRQLVTQTLRALRAPHAGALDFQLEVMTQLGASHATAAASDTTPLRHVAFGAHAELGFRFAVPWEPRALLQYDYASGDANPDDGVNGRFDPLFGARRFDLTPTGLWGALPRSNINTPGLRVEVHPHPRVDAFVAWRVMWLASARDAWTVTGLRDPTGRAGAFLGQQGDARLRWHVFPRNLSVEVGGALLVPGTFVVANQGSWAPSLYAYSQLVGSL
ncbi:MAG: alginate export family protein [Myxococcaceae bacterium]|nr:alginate export family protein [Myxococcaceae bacterium]